VDQALTIRHEVDHEYEFKGGFVHQVEPRSTFLPFEES
jgi:hypothetical protein